MKPPAARIAVAALIIWLPYIASTGLQERFAGGGMAGNLLMLLAFLMVWPAARLIGRRDPFALSFDRRVLLVFALAVAAGFAIQCAHWIAGQRLGVLSLAPPAAGGLPLDVVAMMVLTTFIPSITEDVLTRGFPLFASPPRGWPAAGFIGFSAALYTLNNLWRFDWGWQEQARLFAMGLAFAAAALRFRSLWAAVGLHWGGNLIASLAPLGEVTAVDVARDRLLSAALYFVVAVALAASMRVARQASREAQAVG